MLLRAWAAPLLALVGAVILALGPTVARIRRLGAKVRASAEHRYSELVEMPGNDEIADLAAAFDGAAREVRAHLDAQEQREQTLRDFLANTAHDVMTPLTVLQGHLAGLRAAVTAGTAVDAATLDAALDEATYMGALLNNLAVAARLEAGEPHLVRVPVDVARVVERCVSRHGPMARQRGVAMEHAVPERAALIHGDVTFLEQAIGNVVYNAVRHNREGGHVAVVLSSRGETGFRVRVADDGPGMSDEDLARLNVGGAVDAARTRHADGHGLGLSITRRVAALHGMSLVFARSDAGGLEVDFEWAD
jgi:signal transduction histidine kinase